MLLTRRLHVHLCSVGLNQPKSKHACVSLCGEKGGGERERERESIDCSAQVNEVERTQVNDVERTQVNDGERTQVNDVRGHR